jgi:hypothetical protein
MSRALTFFNKLSMDYKRRIFGCYFFFGLKEMETSKKTLTNQHNVGKHTITYRSQKKIFIRNFKSLHLIEDIIIFY